MKAGYRIGNIYTDILREYIQWNAIWIAEMKEDNGCSICWKLL